MDPDNRPLIVRQAQLAQSLSAEQRADRDARRREKALLDFDLDVSYEYIGEQVRQAIEDRSAESARAYLGTYGDAATERVRRSIAESEALLTGGHPGAAIVLAATAVELTVRELVVRPLVQGAFLSDQWAAILTNQIVGDRPADGRRLLIVIAEAWELDLEEVRLADGSPAWAVFTGSVLPVRNAFVHRADPVSEDVAARAIQTAQALLDGLMLPLARRFGVDWPSKPWCRGHDIGGFEIHSFAPQDPFLRRRT